MARWILHVDMDAFFASVEQLDEPMLRGRPVVVGGLGPRGVVSTASYEARAYGVHSAMPTARARVLCPNAAFLPPRFSRYEELAKGVRAILASYSPSVEPVSLDEAFVDLTGTEWVRGPVEAAAEGVRHRIQLETGLSCSVGLAPNKLLAKLASEAAKPGGTHVVREEDVDGFLSPLSVGRLWGVGPQTARKLAERGIRTVGDLRAVDASLLHSWFGPTSGTHLWRLARGIDDTPVIASHEPKSLSQEVTFADDLRDEEVIATELRRLASTVVERLAAEQLLATTVRVKIRWSDFTTRTRQVRLPEPTDHPAIIADAAVALLERGNVLAEGGVRLLGVGLAGLVAATFRPGHLFILSGQSREFPSTSGPGSCPQDEDSPGRTPPRCGAGYTISQGGSR
ncbi:MAG: DNA polymerase IV [Candidatus Bipolaricaulis sibiricus]|uniref:DNA polymerase IV n=1 Tax=Bipolaricaulis sibiricus TaxID=2501609 RepID=A0A410FUU3_BIPS1|nr:MAG: DNA polymerase IV [Candidatus Bipolaricaulis sibiricus]